eukprot:1160806-Pelagomonas_calceolata.AAC.4
MAGHLIKSTFWGFRGAGGSSKSLPVHQFWQGKCQVNITEQPLHQMGSRHFCWDKYWFRSRAPPNTYVQVIKKQIAEGVTKRRVGFVSSGAPARQHTEIKSNDGSKVGEAPAGKLHCSVLPVQDSVNNLACNEACINRLSRYCTYPPLPYFKSPSEHQVQRLCSM